MKQGFKSERAFECFSNAASYEIGRKGAVSSTLLRKVRELSGSVEIIERWPIKELRFFTKLSEASPSFSCQKNVSMKLISQKVLTIM